MRASICSMVMAALICVLASLASPAWAASEHVVSPAELQQAARSASRTRQENVAKIEKFFSTPPAVKAFQSAHLNPAQIKRAVPALSDQEVASLAARADKAQKDFAAGALTNQQITYILIALATAVIVLILV